MADIVVDEKDLRILRLTLGPWQTNAYIVVCPKTEKSALIDAPANAKAIMEALRGTQLQYVLMTHGHGDHTGALAEVCSALKVPLAAHAADGMALPHPVSVLLRDGESIQVGNLKLDAIHTPGHTPGSVCFRVGSHLLAGDTIFPGGPGHTDSPDNFREILANIEARVLTLPPEVRIYPGHGEPTTVKTAREEFAAFTSRPHDLNLYGDVLWLST